MYQNLGPPRSILKAPESKNLGGGRIYHPLCNVGLRLGILSILSSPESYLLYLASSIFWIYFTVQCTILRFLWYFLQLVLLAFVNWSSKLLATVIKWWFSSCNVFRWTAFSINRENAIWNIKSTDPIDSYIEKLIYN